jgi:hypothetical protein
MQPQQGQQQDQQQDQQHEQHGQHGQHEQQKQQKQHRQHDQHSILFLHPPPLSSPPLRDSLHHNRLLPSLAPLDDRRSMPPMLARCVICCEDRKTRRRLVALLPHSALVPREAWPCGERRAERRCGFCGLCSLCGLCGLLTTRYVGGGWARAGGQVRHASARGTTWALSWALQPLSSLVLGNKLSSASCQQAHYRC